MATIQGSCSQDFGSIQSHLSTSNSQKRFRATPSTVGIAQKIEEPQDVHTGTRTMNFINRLFFRMGLMNMTLPAMTYDRQTFTRVWLVLFVKWMAAVYCFLSCMILTIDCYKYLCISIANNGPFRTTSYLNDLSLGNRLSRLTTSQNVLDFEPYLIQHPVADDMSTTAGLWVKDDEDLDLLLAWIHNWPGPLSVVMTTEDNLSSNYSKLLYRIRDLENRLGTSQLSLHLLHIRSHNTLALNVYLNFARLFALTSRIVLFPTPISQLPPRDLYGLIGMQDLSRPAFITTPSRAAYPFNPLSPILLMRNHSIWCTERHFVHSDRAAEWRECIWQIWTESLGKASKIIMHGVSSEDNGGRRETDVIHTRTSTIYRIEYCDLILRSFAPGNRSGPKTSLNWLKHFCAETVDKRYRL